MSIEYKFKIKGELLPLNIVDEVLCDYEGVECSSTMYCETYLLLKDLVIPMVTHDVEVINKHFDIDTNWVDDALQGNIDKVKKAIKDLNIEIYAWRD